MSNPKFDNLNFPGVSPPVADNFQSTALQVLDLNAAFVGTTNDTVGRFDGATGNLGDRALADWAIRNTGDEAADGTEFKITLRGIYGVVGYLATTNAGTVECGVSMDGATTTDPNFASGATLANVRRTLAAGDVVNYSLTGFALVTAARAANASLGIIRFNVSSGGGAAPTSPPLNAADCGMKIYRIADLA